MKNIDYNKYIWKGWTVQDFIEALEDDISYIMADTSIIPPFKNKDELKKYCMENQPYYKRYIPEVIEHFANKYNIK
jgi:hypothetical protein|nr:MAG TPA: hypothetical protein [Crassvirales sp.]